MTKWLDAVLFFTSSLLLCTLVSPGYVRTWIKGLATVTVGSGSRTAGGKGGMLLSLQYSGSSVSSAPCRRVGRQPVWTFFTRFQGYP